MNLREWLFKQRMSIKYFSDTLQVDRSYVHKWMMGKHVPSDDLMMKIRELTLDEVHEKDELKDLEISRNADNHFANVGKMV